MSWQDRVNRTLVRATGYQLRKVGPRRRRVRPSRATGCSSRPAFVLSSVRSGSTLLRVLLDSHSAIHSPQELHLRDITVGVREGYPADALKEIGLDEKTLQELLWDRVLHRELVESGKRLIVNKTPNDVFIADRIKECWPDARFLFLLRHPAAVAQSRQTARPQDSPERNVKMVRRYCVALQRARETYPGLTLRYEDLAADPARVTREVCAFLGVEWEPAMLEYGRVGHGRFRAGLGDWSENIKSGRVQAPAPLPAADEVPAPLRAVVPDVGLPARPRATRRPTGRACVRRAPSRPFPTAGRVRGGAAMARASRSAALSPRRGRPGAGGRSTARARRGRAP